MEKEFKISELERFRFRLDNLKSLIANSDLRDRQKIYSLIPNYLIELEDLKAKGRVGEQEQKNYIKASNELKQMIKLYCK